MRKDISAEAKSLNATIAQAEADLQTFDTGSEQYAKALAHVERLYKLRASNAPKQIDPNTWLIVGGNLLGILIVVGYERAHVLGGKAIGFAGKLR